MGTRATWQGFVDYRVLPALAAGYQAVLGSPSIQKEVRETLLAALAAELRRSDAWARKAPLAGWLMSVAPLARL